MSKAIRPLNMMIIESFRTSYKLYQKPLTICMVPEVNLVVSG
ncbi:MAG: hypothetical protein BAJATHORv1_30455 [Candidatus Thorarchaeota archaeon]|nr:MAG: hypothetical protein BAJATHORv1_30455 [Candidatus Thorarchaeota archaeon]